MSDSFVIDIWSAVVCPFCYLGTRQLEVALQQFDHRAHVVQRLRAFELDPVAPTDYAMSLPELLAKKYSMPVERARAMNDRLEEQARSLGMSWSLATALPTNTFDAHRLIALAATEGLAQPMVQRLFRAYFSEGALLSDRAVLESLALEVGVRSAHDLWEGDLYTSDVRDDEAQAQDLGISGVPSILIDGTFMVVGAQGSPQILEALNRAWDRSNA